jgi:REP element-mobilizing transposase RayT
MISTIYPETLMMTKSGRDVHGDTPAQRKTVASPEPPKTASAPDRSAGVPPAVAGASRPRFGEVTIHDRGRLPDWEKESATYFVTFRLHDSLPKSVLERIESERESLVKTAKQLSREISPSEHKKLQKLSTKVIEQYLDSGAGACHLKHPAVANIVADALRHFDNKRYRLFAWCVMPNHVHVVCKLFPGHALAEIIHSWKSFSAKHANDLLNRSGSFWQREYYDHLVRDEAEFERAVRYVAENPGKTGLRNWRGVWVGGWDARPTAGETPALRKPGRLS